METAIQFGRPTLTARTGYSLEQEYFLKYIISLLGDFYNARLWNSKRVGRLDERMNGTQGEYWKYTFKKHFNIIALVLGNILVWHKDTLRVYEEFAFRKRPNLLADFYGYLDTIDVRTNTDMAYPVT
jgi:hypothetical protein